MVVADPAAELLGLVREQGDPAPCRAEPVELQRALLVRRRFGLALPLPFADHDPSAPIRVATAEDGPAIAAVKWRAFGTSYRGLLPDGFLDQRDVVPPPAFWIGRAMVPPTRRHRLLVWGRPGTVQGYLDAGPAEEGDDGWSSTTGQVYELYVDPCAQGGGGGARLLHAATDALTEAGFRDLCLHTLATNGAAQGFYEHHGWATDGTTVAVDLGVVAFDEVVYTRTIA